MISIVVPVFNEEESLSYLYKELVSSLKSYKDYEIIFIDDGSTDNSLQLLKKIAEKNKRVRIYSFRKNQGKAEVLTLGFQKAKGDYIVTLDADLQDKPQEISKLLNKMGEGWDLVCGWRKNRRDPLPKVLSSKFFNLFARILWGLKLHDYNCGLKLFTKEAAHSLKIYGGLHRFIPLILYQQGFKVSEIAVSHDKRRFGKSKYGFSKLWKDLPDIFTMLFLTRYSKRPLHFFGLIGFLLLILGLGILIYLTINKIFAGVGIGDRPLFFLGILLVLSGFQLFFTGFLADLIINVSQRGDKEFPVKYSTD